MEEVVEKTEAYIKINDEKGSKDLEISPFFRKILVDDVKISYPSLKTQREENLIIKTPE